MLVFSDQTNNSVGYQRRSGVPDPGHAKSPAMKTGLSPTTLYATEVTTYPTSPPRPTRCYVTGLSVGELNAPRTTINQLNPPALKQPAGHSAGGGDFRRMFSTSSLRSLSKYGIAVSASMSTASSSSLDVNVNNSPYLSNNSSETERENPTS